MNAIINMNHAMPDEPEYTPPAADEAKALEIGSLEKSIRTATVFQVMRPSKKNAAFIDSLRAQLAALTTPAELPDNATLTDRLAQLESTIDESSPEAAREMLGEIIELRDRLQLDGWIDEQADGRLMARNLSDTSF